MTATDVKINKDIRLLTKEQMVDVVTHLGEKKSKALLIYKELWTLGARSLRRYRVRKSSLSSLATPVLLVCCM